MRNADSHFEQIPLEQLRRLIGQGQVTRFGPTGGPRVILECGICHLPVPVETAKTDSDGKAVHDACYLNSLALTALFSRTRRIQPGR
jgi:hypothetical protein